MVRRTALMLAALASTAMVAGAQPYYPSMVYHAKQTLAPGVTAQRATNANPAHNIWIIEVDMTRRNVELMPVFKAAGNVSGSANERTSSMAARTDAIAAVNAGYFTTDGTLLTNSYTEIDGLFIGGSGTNLRPEGNRSVLGFSGNHQAIAKRTKLSTAFVPADATNWDKIVDGIAGRGHFVTSGGTVVTVDNEGTGESHYGSRHPRTAIGYSANPYRAFLVTVDGRQTGVAVGMTYTELAQLMADLGVEQSISLDGGGSTAAWIKGSGVVNVPSDGSERSVISAWAVIEGNTMDNSVEETSFTGTWATDTAATDKYYLDHRTTDNTAGAATATWRPDLERGGLYKVYAWWSAAAGRATAAPYAIAHRGGTTTINANQTANGGRWNLLGAWSFDAGTSGSVTLANTATGTLSADAVRFVRVTGDPDPIVPGYDVTGLVYQNDFESVTKSTDFVVSEAVAGDNSINYSFDYSTFAQAAGGFPASIPQSPTSSGPGTRAMRMAVNLNNGVINAITATLATVPAQSNFRLTFDAWINYNGPAGGGTGSTEFLAFGATTNSALYTLGASNYLTGTNSPFNGFYFAVSGEGGSSQDYRYYDGTGAAARGNNGARANYFGTAAVDHLAATGVFPAGQYETNGAPGKSWNRWEVIHLNGQLRLIVNKPDGTSHVLCDWFTPNSSTPTSGLRPAFGTFDPFAGVANPGSDNFVLIDNIVVQSIAPPGSTSVDDWLSY